MVARRNTTVQAVAYVRVSTARQHADAQLRQIRQVAKTVGARLGRVYRDVASSVKERPELDQLVRDARLGRVCLVVVWALDRLGRELWEIADRVRELDALGVRLVSVREPWLDSVNSSPETRKLWLSIGGWWAEMEHHRLRQRTAEGLAAAKARGVRLGRPPAHIPEEAKRLARRLRSGGVSWRHTAEELARQGFCQAAKKRGRGRHPRRPWPIGTLRDSLNRRTSTT